MESAVYAVAQLARNRVCGSRLNSMNVIPPLIVLLDGSDTQKYHAVCALALFAEYSSESCRKIADNGGIGPLSGLLHGTHDEKRLAMQALGNIASIDENVRKEIVRHGAIEPLFEMVELDVMKEPALFALSNIAIDLESWRGMDTNEVIKKIIKQLKNTSDAIKEHSAMILAPLYLSDDIHVKKAINPLVEVAKSGSHNAKNKVSAVLANLSTRSSNHETMVNCSVLEVLMKMLSASNVQKDNALLALTKFVPAANYELIEQMRKAKIVDALRDMLVNGSDYQVAKSLRLLWDLMRKTPCKVFYDICSEFRGTLDEVKQLTTTGTVQQRKFASMVLNSLTTARTKILDDLQADLEETLDESYIEAINDIPNVD